jgi:hypothetical protein
LKGVYTLINKKYWFLSITLVVMVGCYLLGSYFNDNESRNFKEPFNNQSYNSTPTMSTDQSSKSYSGKTTEQIPQTNNIAGKQQQMVYQANIHLHVTKLQAAKTELDKIAKQTKATIISSSDAEKLDGRNLRITYSVPQQQFQLFIDHSKKISNTVPDIQIQGEDVSEELVDLNARIKAKKAMEARLLAMMGKAVTTSDLLDIENTLGGVQEQLEQLTGRQQYLQHRVAFSKITVEISSSAYQHVQTKKSFIDQTSQAFVDSCENIWIGLQLFVIWLSQALPYLILITIIIVPVLLYIKKRKNK